MSSWLILLWLTILSITLLIILRWDLSLLLNRCFYAIPLWLFSVRFYLFFRDLFSFLLSLLSLFFFLLSLFSKFLCPASNKFLNFLFLKLFLIFLSRLCSLEFFCFSLPLNNLISYNIDSFLVINSSSNIFFELCGISLPI